MDLDGSTLAEVTGWAINAAVVVVAVGSGLAHERVVVVEPVVRLTSRVEASAFTVQGRD